MEGSSNDRGSNRKAQGEALALIVPEQQQDVGQSSEPVICMERDIPQAKQFSKMSPTQLRHFIMDGLSLEQKKDIESLGFGSLLELKTDEYPSDLCRWLLRHYNPLQSCLELEKETLKIGADDFQVILGLPNVGQKVTEVGRRMLDFEHGKQVNAWVSQFDKPKNNITVTDIRLKLREQKTGGVNFKRNFVILVVSTLLKSNQKGSPNLSIMKCLENVDSIGNFNWCQYALECLNDCSREWLASDGVSRFTGPALPFVLCYLDRVAIMGRSHLRRFPLLGCWEKKQIQERRSYELKYAGSYGKGQVRPCFVLDFEEIETLDSHRDSKKACIHQVAESAIALSKAFNSFVQNLGSAKLVFPNSDAITKLDKATTLMTEVFEEEVTEKKSTQEEQGTTGKIPMVDLDDLFNDPLFVEAYEELEKSFGKKPVVGSGPINQPQKSENEQTGAVNKGEEEQSQGISCPLVQADHEKPSFSLGPELDSNPSQQPQHCANEQQPSNILTQVVNMEKGTSSHSQAKRALSKEPSFSLGIEFDFDPSQQPQLCENEQPNNILPRVVNKGKRGTSQLGLPLRTSPRLQLNSKITESKNQQTVELRAAKPHQHPLGLSHSKRKRTLGKEPSFSLGIEFDSDPNLQPQLRANDRPNNILPKVLNKGKGGTIRPGLPVRTSPRLQNVELRAAKTQQQHQELQDPLRSQPIRRSPRLGPTNNQCLGC